MNRIVLLELLCFTFCLVAPRRAAAQLADFYRTDYRIMPDRKGELRVEIDNMDFFKDNEYAGSVMAGYSLPGLWLQPRLTYYPVDNIKLEAGIHLLKYWGATKYPNMAYVDIATWQGRQYQHGVHLLPFFRAQVAVSEHLDIVLGNLYGGATHRLIDPLYAPELNLTADPEAGLQLLYHARRFELDAWVNWQSFIFRQDVHQEAFTVGLSTRLRGGCESSGWQWYVPLQGLIQHRGGEIDTIFSGSVQTLMNGALGFGTVWHPKGAWLDEVGAEVDALGYYQQAGSLWPFSSGTGVYAKAWADKAGFRLKASYFAGDKFISMYGLPFYGSVSTKEPGLTYRHPQTGYVGLEYTYRFGEGYAIGAEVEVYYRFAGDALRAATATTMATTMEATAGVTAGAEAPMSVASFSVASFSKASGGVPDEAPDGMPAAVKVHEKGATSFSAGVYLRLSPSFLLKRFGGK